MRKTLIILTVVLTGCATQPKPIFAPPPNCINIPGEGCKKFGAGNVGGTTLGNRDEIVSQENTP